MPTLDDLKKMSDDKAKLQEAYKLWGNMQDTIKKEGWYPEMIDPQTKAATFVTQYNQAFNNVVIPGEKEYGHVVVIAKPDSTFDVAVRTAGGQIKSYVYRNANANTVQDWMTNKSSNVAARVAHPDGATQIVKQ